MAKLQSKIFEFLPRANLTQTDKMQTPAMTTEDHSFISASSVLGSPCN
jgi:hypothetical protein